MSNAWNFSGIKFLATELKFRGRKKTFCPDMFTSSIIVPRVLSLRLYYTVYSCGDGKEMYEKVHVQKFALVSPKQSHGVFRLNSYPVISAPHTGMWQLSHDYSSRCKNGSRDKLRLYVKAVFPDKLYIRVNLLSNLNKFYLEPFMFTYISSVLLVKFKMQQQTNVT